MADLAGLKEQIRQAESRGDYAAITRHRADIARDFPGTPEAAEALFRLGLYFLFAESNVEAAAQTFEEAIKTKDATWSKAARVSLASLYLREGKPQKALLELRKATVAGEPPSIHTVSALSIIQNICEEAGDHAAARKAGEDRVEVLQALIVSARKQGDETSATYFQSLLDNEPQEKKA